MRAARLSGHLGGRMSAQGECTPPPDSEADTPVPLHAGIHTPRITDQGGHIPAKIKFPVFPEFSLC